MLPIEAGVMKPDPVYINQRIPKLKDGIQEQLQLFEGQMYILESLELQNFQSQLSVVSRQAFLHFVLLFHILEQLRESIEAINGTADYYLQLEAQYAAEKPYGWNAYQKFLKTCNKAFESEGLGIWKESMTLRGHDVSKIVGGTARAIPPAKIVENEQASAPIPKRKRNGPEPVAPPPRTERPLDSRDFKAPPVLVVTPEIRGHLPAQAYAKPEPITTRPPLVVKGALKKVKLTKKGKKAETKPAKTVEPKEESGNEVIMTPAQKRRAELMAQLQELDAESPSPVEAAKQVRKRSKTEL